MHLTGHMQNSDELISTLIRDYQRGSVELSLKVPLKFNSLETLNALDSIIASIFTFLAFRLSDKVSCFFLVLEKTKTSDS